MNNILQDSIRGVLENARADFGNHVAFKLRNKASASGYREITYTEFLEDIRTLGTALMHHGYEKVAVIGKNSYEWLLSYYGIVCGGITVIPLDKGLPIDELVSCLERSEVDAIIFEDDIIGNLAEALSKSNLKKRPDLIFWGEALENTEFSDFNLSLGSEEMEKGRELLGKGDSRYDNKKIHRNHLASILFTSGTSGTSKAVMLSHHNIASCVYDMNNYISFRDTDVNMVFLPLHHTFGNTGTLMMLSNGVCNVFCDGLKFIQKNMQEYRVSVFIGVPLLIENIYSKLIKQVEKQGAYGKLKRAVKLSNFLRKLGIDVRRKLFRSIYEAFGGELRMMISGASALSPEVSKSFNEMGIIAIQGYGLTETSPTISSQPIGHTFYESAGVLMGSVEARIEDPDENGVGELVVRGPNVMLGYYENPEETAKVLKNGWFYTGDLAYIDWKNDKTVFLKGRKKNVIVLKNGKNVFPEELEDIIDRLPYVNESLVYGENRAEGDSTENLAVSARIVVNMDELKKSAVASGETIKSDATEQELMDSCQAFVQKDIDFINSELPIYKKILRIYITEEAMEKTTTMKIKRYKVLEQK